MDSIDGVEIVIVNPRVEPRGGVRAVRTHVATGDDGVRTAIVRELFRDTAAVFPDGTEAEAGDPVSADAFFVHVPLAEAAAFFDTDEADEAFVAWYQTHFVPADVAADVRDAAAADPDTDDEPPVTRD